MKLIGQIWLEGSLMTGDQLEEGLRLQKTAGVSSQQSRMRLGEYLVQKGELTEEAVAQGLALQWQLPCLTMLDLGTIDPALSRQIPISFAKRHELLPLARVGKQVQVAVSDPRNIEGIDQLALQLESVLEIFVAPRSLLIAGIQHVYEQAGQPAEMAIADLSYLSQDRLAQDPLKAIAEQIVAPTDLLETADTAPIIRMVNAMLFQAVIQRASDIHFEPFEQEMSVRYRIDGILHSILTIPKRLQPALLSRVKIMAGMDIAEKRLPQDGRMALRIGNRHIDVRASDVPVHHGERLVLRLLDRSRMLLNLGEMGLSSELLSIVSRLTQAPHGMILVTGPTGSGKTTTLYAALNAINTPEKNIITIEDPIEYQLKGIGQIQVNPKIDLTFAGGLRSMLRQDPDVMMVGEIRDVETAQIAIHAALTGHLVFSTLHTNDAVGAITRLLDMGVEPFLIASSVLAVVAQRLVRRICPQCRIPHTLSEWEREQRILLPSFGRDIDAPVFYRGKGCGYCAQTGFYGRVGIFEMLSMEDEMRTGVLNKADASRLRQQALKQGMISLREDGLRHAQAGVTTFEEVLRVTQDI